MSAGEIEPAQIGACDGQLRIKPGGLFERLASAGEVLRRLERQREVVSGMRILGINRKHLAIDFGGFGRLTGLQIFVGLIAARAQLSGLDFALFSFAKFFGSPIGTGGITEFA